jgi:hypothetical protein
MNTRGSITLGDLVGKVTMVEIACSKCDRRGLLRLDRLIEEHGAGIGLPVLGGYWRATAQRPTPSASMTAAASIFRNCPNCSCSGAD